MLKSKVISLLVISTLVVSVVIFVPLVHSANWPQFRFDERHTGYSPTEDFPVPNVEHKWTTAYGSNKTLNYTSPVIFGNWMFVITPSGYIDGLDNSFQYKNVPTNWSMFIENYGYSTPAGVLLGGKIYVFVCTTKGKIYAISAMDSWGTNIIIKKTIDIGTGIYASPTVATFGTETYLYVASNDGTLYCYDVTGISSGNMTEKWKYSDIKSYIWSSPAVDVTNSRVYVGAYDGKIYALNAVTGAINWIYPTEGPIRSSPAIGSDGTVYVGSTDGKVYALNYLTASLKQGFPYVPEGTNNAFLSSPAIADQLYIGSYNGKLYKIDTATGGKLWESNPLGSFYSSPAIESNSICIGSKNGTMYAFDTGGNQTWSYQQYQNSSIDSSPAIYNNKLYFISANGSADYFTISGPNTPPATSIVNAETHTNPGVILTWTAPGDDVYFGQATQYDIRYRTDVPITESNWATSTPLTNVTIPTPSESGSAETLTITGLDPGTNYYFALKTADEVPNWSAISNILSTGGNWDFESGNLNNWTSWGQVDGIQTGSFYNIPPQSGTYYLGTSAQYQTKNGGVYQQVYVTQGIRYKASCWIRTYQNGGANWDTLCRIGIDPTGGTNPSGNIVWSGWMDSVGTWYYLETNTVANGNVATVFLEQWHKWALERNVTCFDKVEFVPIDSVAPAAVNNLSGQPGSTGGTVALTWTSPGDDGNIGTATEYDIRYSLSSITESNWSSTTQVTGEPTPLVAGSQQTFTIGSLTPGGTYYFALKTRDEVSNWSGLSNVTQTYANPWISGGNWGFEDGNLNNWTVWGQVDGIQTGSFYNIPPQSGTYYLGTSAQYQTKNGGVYQRVSAVSGRQYKTSCYIRTYQNGGANWDTLCRIGIDPTGGTDPGSGNIVWAGWWDSVGSWTYREITATANGSAVTVFLEQWHKWALERNVTCFDTVELIDLGGGQGAPRLSLDPRMAILNDAEATEFRLRDSYVTPNPSIVEGNNRVYAALPGGIRGAPSRSGGIRLAMFVGLADKVKARVYTVAGELVYEGELDGSEYTILQGKDNKPGIAYVINWSGINQEGSKVIPGVYICIMDAEKKGYSPLRKSSKLAIIK